MSAPSLDLHHDVAAPEDLVALLRQAAEKYRDTAGHLQESWGDEQAGRVWDEFATILDRAAKSCDKAIEKHYPSG